MSTAIAVLYRIRRLEVLISACVCFSSLTPSVTLARWSVSDVNNPRDTGQSKPLTKKRHGGFDHGCVPKKNSCTTVFKITKSSNVMKVIFERISQLPSELLPTYQ